ncbi:uncharacterized protein LOC108623015 [Ceratina calcarata]|uniref:Uncharacterized protein LOC108623015 n=1 Tax=Ceratina calcarata TaxID=156304 RepID=A0AAJ7IU61_9HYME|nr:uncharacterized protein LOC108623015 [Ceratina calcarata]
MTSAKATIVAHSAKETFVRMPWRLTLLSLFSVMGIQASGNELLREERQAVYPPPLVYPFVGMFKLVVGLAMPVKLSGRTLSYGQNIQFQYALPDNASFFTDYFDGTYRRRKRSSWDERTPVYDILRQELDRRDIDGKECLKKNICEAAASPLRDEGLIGELLDLLLTPGPTMDEEYLEAATIGRNRENCSMIYSTCPDGLGVLDRISIIY